MKGFLLISRKFSFFWSVIRKFSHKFSFSLKKLYIFYCSDIEILKKTSIVKKNMCFFPWRAERFDRYRRDERCDRYYTDAMSGAIAIAVLSGAAV